MNRLFPFTDTVVAPPVEWEGTLIEKRLERPKPKAKPVSVTWTLAVGQAVFGAASSSPYLVTTLIWFPDPEKT